MAQAPARMGIQLDFGVQRAFDAAACIPVFHRWIQQKRLDDILIDVVDYRHVPGGPGLLLVGLEADYAVREKEGRLVVGYTRKRAMPASLVGSMIVAFRQAVRAAVSLHAETSLAGVHERVEFQFLDRLRYPNDPSRHPRLLREAALLFASLYGGGVETEFVETDERWPLTVRVNGVSPSYETLLRRLDQVGSDLAAGAPAEGGR